MSRPFLVIAHWLPYICLATFQPSVSRIVSTVGSQVNTTKIPAQDECNGWKTYGGFCYHVFETFEYFSTAKDLCKRQKSNLASISSEAENNFVRDIVKVSTRYSEAWIGYEYNTKIVAYQWIDGSKSNYKNWIHGRPGPEGYCVEIIPGGKWSNILCNNRLQYVCKKAKAVQSQNKQTLQVIILVTIPLSCVFLMITFVAYLWIRSVHQLTAFPPVDTKQTQHFVELTASTSAVGTERQTSLQSISIDAEKSDATDQTVMQLYRKMSERRSRNYTTIRGEDGIYKKVSLV